MARCVYRRTLPTCVSRPNVTMSSTCSVTCDTCRFRPLPSWKSRVNSFSSRILASCWVAANELAAREASDSVSGWYSSEAVVIGWPEVLMSARKLEPDTSLSFWSSSSQRSSCLSLMTSPLRRATSAPFVYAPRSAKYIPASGAARDNPRPRASGGAVSGIVIRAANHEAGEEGTAHLRT